MTCTAHSTERIAPAASRHRHAKALRRILSFRPEVSCFLETPSLPFPETRFASPTRRRRRRGFSASRSTSLTIAVSNGVVNQGKPSFLTKFPLGVFS